MSPQEMRGGRGIRKGSGPSFIYGGSCGERGVLGRQRGERMKTQLIQIIRIRQRTVARREINTNERLLLWDGGGKEIAQGGELSILLLTRLTMAQNEMKEKKEQKRINSGL